MCPERRLSIGRCRGLIAGSAVASLSIAMLLVSSTSSYATPAQGLGQRSEQLSCTIQGTARADDLVGTGGSDVICGLAGDDRIRGLGGNDIILGGTGDDRIWAGRGNDIVVGGSGADRVHAGAGTDLLTANGANTVHLGHTTISNPSWTNILTGVWAQTAEMSNDMFTPWVYDTWVHLLPETLMSDYVNGWAGHIGDDMFFPSPGDDFLDGGPGHDVLIGRPGGDRLDSRA